MCFNAAKLWQLGWNGNRHLTLNSSNPSYIGKLAGIVDDPNTPGPFMIIKVDDPSGKNYFINFNVRADFNSGSKEGGDEILVIRAGDGIDYSESQLKAKLGSGSSYTVENFDNGKTLLVEVTSISMADRIANVRICLGECPPDCTSRSQCDDSDACTTDACVQGVCSNSRIESEQCSVCPGERELDLRIVTDKYPAETSWELRNKCTNNSIVAQGGGYTTRDTEFGSGKMCVPIGEYEFIVKDKFGDGICCRYGDGSFAIKYNGNVVDIASTQFSFAFSQTVTFGENCPEQIIKMSPPPLVVVPSKSPTVAPSRSPTAQPSAKPSSSPSVSPSTFPSNQPSLSSPDIAIPWCGDINRSSSNFCQKIAESMWRCDDPIIKSKCPVTCGVRCNCYDVDLFDHNGNQKNCAWAKQKKKCTKSKFRTFCPKTCGDCV